MFRQGAQVATILNGTPNSENAQRHWRRLRLNFQSNRAARVPRRDDRDPAVRLLIVRFDTDDHSAHADSLDGIGERMEVVAVDGPTDDCPGYPAMF